jgi:hypothetical protein
MRDEGFAESGLSKIDEGADGPPYKCTLKSMCHERFEVLY